MKKQTKSIVSIVTIAIFMVSQLVDVTPAYAEARLLNPEVKVSPSFHLDIPSDLGTIETISQGNGPTLIHIQDAHGNYDAQKNIQAMLHHLKDQYGVDTVLLEGAAVKLESDILRFFPNQMNVTMSIAEYLTKEALVKGPELFLIETPDAKGYGIEDVDSYLVNGEAFEAVLTASEKSEEFINDMNRQIERLTSPYLNKDLRSFIKRLESFEEKKLPISEWLHYLKDQAVKLRQMDLGDATYQLDWPALVRVFKMHEFERKMDHNAFAKERDVFLRAIKGIPQDAYQRIEQLLTAKLSRHQLPDPETGLLFEQMTASLGPDFDYEQYPNVSLFIGHLILQSEIKGDKMVREMNRLTDMLSDNLAKTNVEKKLLELLKNHRLLKKLFALELTPDDYEKILNAEDGSLKPSAIIGQFQKINESGRVRDLEFGHIEEINQLYDAALIFYSSVKDRDIAMLANVEKRMAQAGVKKAAVITGGFHAGPFKNYFMSRDYNYALISPKITSLEGREEYIEAALENEAGVGLKASTRMLVSYLAPHGQGVRFSRRSLSRVARATINGLGDHGLTQARNPGVIRVEPHTTDGVHVITHEDPRLWGSPVEVAVETTLEQRVVTTTTDVVRAPADSRVRVRLAYGADDLGIEVPADFGWNQLVQQLIEAKPALSRYVRDQADFRQAVTDVFGVSSSAFINDRDRLALVLYFDPAIGRGYEGVARILQTSEAAAETSVSNGIQQILEALPARYLGNRSEVRRPENRRRFLQKTTSAGLGLALLDTLAQVVGAQDAPRSEQDDPNTKRVGIFQVSLPLDKIGERVIATHFAPNFEQPVKYTAQEITEFTNIVLARVTKKLGVEKFDQRNRDHVAELMSFFKLDQEAPEGVEGETHVVRFSRFGDNDYWAKSWRGNANTLAREFFWRWQLREVVHHFGQQALQPGDISAWSQNDFTPKRTIKQAISRFSAMKRDSKPQTSDDKKKGVGVFKVVLPEGKIGENVIAVYFAANFEEPVTYTAEELNEFADLVLADVLKGLKAESFDRNNREHAFALAEYFRLTEEAPADVKGETHVMSAGRFGDTSHFARTFRGDVKALVVEYFWRWQLREIVHHFGGSAPTAGDISAWTQNDFSRKLTIKQAIKNYRNRSEIRQELPEVLTEAVSQLQKLLARPDERPIERMPEVVGALRAVYEHPDYIRFSEGAAHAQLEQLIEKISSRTIAAGPTGEDFDLLTNVYLDLSGLRLLQETRRILGRDFDADPRPTLPAAIAALQSAEALVDLRSEQPLVNPGLARIFDLAFQYLEGRSNPSTFVSDLAARLQPGAGLNLGEIQSDRGLIANAIGALQNEIGKQLLEELVRRSEVRDRQIQFKLEQPDEVRRLLSDAPRQWFDYALPDLPENTQLFNDLLRVLALAEIPTGLEDAPAVVSFDELNPRVIGLFDDGRPTEFAIGFTTPDDDLLIVQFGDELAFDPTLIVDEYFEQLINPQGLNETPGTPRIALIPEGFSAVSVPDEQFTLVVPDEIRQATRAFNILRPIEALILPFRGDYSDRLADIQDRLRRNELANVIDDLRRLGLDLVADTPLIDSSFEITELRRALAIFDDVETPDQVAEEGVRFSELYDLVIAKADQVIYPQPEVRVGSIDLDRTITVVLGYADDAIIASVNLNPTETRPAEPISTQQYLEQLAADTVARLQGALPAIAAALDTTEPALSQSNAFRVSIDERADDQLRLEIIPDAIVATADARSEVRFSIDLPHGPFAQLDVVETLGVAKLELVASQPRQTDDIAFAEQLAFPLDLRFERYVDFLALPEIIAERARVAAQSDQFDVFAFANGLIGDILPPSGLKVTILGFQPTVRSEVRDDFTDNIGIVTTFLRQALLNTEDKVVLPKNAAASEAFANLITGVDINGRTIQISTYVPASENVSPVHLFPLVFEGKLEVGVNGEHRELVASVEKLLRQIRLLHDFRQSLVPVAVVGQTNFAEQIFIYQRLTSLLGERANNVKDFELQKALESQRAIFNPASGAQEEFSAVLTALQGDGLDLTTSVAGSHAEKVDRLLQALTPLITATFVTEVLKRSEIRNTATVVDAIDVATVTPNVAVEAAQVQGGLDVVDSFDAIGLPDALVSQLNITGPQTLLDLLNLVGPSAVQEPIRSQVVRVVATTVPERLTLTAVGIAPEQITAINAEQFEAVLDAVDIRTVEDLVDPARLVQLFDELGADAPQVFEQINQNLADLGLQLPDVPVVQPLADESVSVVEPVETVSVDVTQPDTTEPVNVAPTGTPVSVDDSTQITQPVDVVQVTQTPTVAQTTPPGVVTPTIDPVDVLETIFQSQSFLDVVFLKDNVVPARIVDEYGVEVTAQVINDADALDLQVVVEAAGIGVNERLSQFQRTVGTTAEVDIFLTEQYLETIRARVAEATAEKLGSILLDSVWMNELLKPRNTRVLFNLLTIFNEISDVAGLTRPLVAVVSDPNVFDRGEDVIQAITRSLNNRRVFTTRQLIDEVQPLISKLNQGRLISVIEVAEGETVESTISSYAAENQGAGIVLSDALAVKGDARFVMTRRAVRANIQAVPFALVEMYMAASSIIDLQESDAADREDMVEAQLLKETIYLQINVVQHGGRTYLVVNSLDSLVDRLTARKYVTVMA